MQIGFRLFFFQQVSCGNDVSIIRMYTYHWHLSGFVTKKDTMNDNSKNKNNYIYNDNNDGNDDFW